METMSQPILKKKGESKNRENWDQIIEGINIDLLN